MACQSNTHPAFSPIPSPSPHTQPTAAVLQSGDVPAGLDVCVGSGPMDVYLSLLAGADAAVASRLSEQWSVMQTQGATEGASSTFATNPTDRRAELVASTSVQGVSRMV